MGVQHNTVRYSPAFWCIIYCSAQLYDCPFTSNLAEWNWLNGESAPKKNVNLSPLFEVPVVNPGFSVTVRLDFLSPGTGLLPVAMTDFKRSFNKVLDHTLDADKRYFIDLTASWSWSGLSFQNERDRGFNCKLWPFLPDRLASSNSCGLFVPI